MKRSRYRNEHNKPTPSFISSKLDGDNVNLRNKRAHAKKRLARINKNAAEYLRNRIEKINDPDTD
jgi:hypothetical protein